MSKVTWLPTSVRIRLTVDSCHGTRRKKDHFKTLLEKQYGKCPDVDVDGNVFEISRRKKILRILVLQRNIIA
jgi:hypothetical protein